MRGSPLSGDDIAVYGRGVLLLLRNPAIIVVPLLMSVISVLLGQMMAPYGGGVFGIAAGGIASMIIILLELFGLGAACIIADDAWRHRTASFDRGWDETRRRGGDILMAAIGFSLLLGVAQYAGMFLGAMFGAIAAYLLMALVFYVLIWSIPAAAVGGIPGAAAIQVSIDRVRAAPLASALAAIVALAVLFVVALLLPGAIESALFPYVPYTPMTAALIGALCQSIALAYIAVVLAKAYTDSAFRR